MSLKIVIAERSSAYCKICGERIMAGNVKLSIYSAHHSVSWCRHCAPQALRERADALERIHGRMV